MSTRKFVFLVAIFLPWILDGCTPWHRLVVSWPPKYVLYRAPALESRLNDYTNWLKAGSIVSNTVQGWDTNYTNALRKIIIWNPDRTNLDQTFTNIAAEYGQADSTYLSAVSNAAFPFITNNVMGWRHSVLTNEPDDDLNTTVGIMLKIADRENYKLFTTEPRLLKSAPDNHGLPQMMSPDLPVCVSLSAEWNEYLAGQTQSAPANSEKANSASGGTNQVQAVFDKLLVTISAAASGPSNTDVNASSENKNASSGNKTTSTAIPDFQQDQNIVLNLSTVLNSASLLDRIDSVSTYVYIYPWQMSLNGNVVLEREFWRNFFSANTAHDPLVRTHGEVLKEDCFRSVEDMRTRVHSLSTTVDLTQVDLGTLQRTFGSTVVAGLTGSATAPPYFPTISPQLNYSGNASATDNLARKQQIDERSTFIDGSGDFFRIYQRGMQSVDLAGRFTNNLTLHVPAASERICYWTPSGNSPNLYTIESVSQPLYSEVDAITFSVVVARQATKLVADREDSFGLDDRKNASLVVSVTQPERIKLWAWERQFGAVTTRDIFGKNSGASKCLFFTTFTNAVPSPLYLVNFSFAQQNNLFAEIYTNSTNQQHHGFAVFSTNIEGMTDTVVTIGCVANEDDPAQLIPLQ